MECRKQLETQKLEFYELLLQLSNWLEKEKFPSLHLWIGWINVLSKLVSNFIILHMIGEVDIQ